MSNVSKNISILFPIEMLFDIISKREVFKHEISFSVSIMSLFIFLSSMRNILNIITSSRQAQMALITPSDKFTRGKKIKFLAIKQRIIIFPLIEFELMIT